MPGYSRSQTTQDRADCLGRGYRAGVVAFLIAWIARPGPVRWRSKCYGYSVHEVITHDAVRYRAIHHIGAFRASPVGELRETDMEARGDAERHAEGRA